MLSPACNEESVGKPAADRNALPLVEALERTLFDVFCNRREVIEVVGTNAANENAGGVEGR